MGIIFSVSVTQSSQKGSNDSHTLTAKGMCVSIVFEFTVPWFFA